MAFDKKMMDNSGIMKGKTDEKEAMTVNVTTEKRRAKEDKIWYAIAAVLFVTVVVCLTVSLISFFSSLPVELTCREDVLELWYENETVFRNAVETGDYGPVEELRGIQEVDVGEKGTNFVCGSTGISVSSHHYSILWLKNDFVPKPDAGWTFNGTAYELDDNDNTYVLEPLGDGFFYYEVHT